MVDLVRAMVELNVSDESDVSALLEGFQHGLQPAGEEFEVVVEQEEDLASGFEGSKIVGVGVALIGLAAQDADAVACQLLESGLRFGGAAVVDDDDFPVVDRYGGQQGLYAGSRQLELPVDGDDEGDLHAEGRAGPPSSAGAFRQREPRRCRWTGSVGSGRCEPSLSAGRPRRWRGAS